MVNAKIINYLKHTNHILFSVLWLVLAVAWAFAFSFIGHMVGGFQWIAHTGQSLPAAMNLLMVILCLVTAIVLLLSKRFPKALAIAIGAVATIHLVNAVGLFILSSTNGRATVLLLPLLFFASVLPTNSNFAGMPVGNISLLLLPLSSIVLSVATRLFKNRSTPQLQTTDNF